MAKDKYYGKTLRKNFARHEEVMAMPNLLEIQKKSYQWFLDTGLREVFADVASIGDYAGNLELSFIDYTHGREAQVRRGGVQGPGRHLCRTPEGQRAPAQQGDRARSRSRRSSWAISP